MEATISEKLEKGFEIISSFYDWDEFLLKEIVKAKKEYFGKTGKINETDKDFSNRMNAFLLWFTFDWRCKENLSTPFEIYKQFLLKKELNDEFSMLEGYENHIHSLFELQKTTKGKTQIRDIYSNKKYQISDTDFLIGCLKGALFETRIFQVGESYHFSNYYIPHPLEVKKNIKKRNKQIRKTGESIKPFIFQLHSYHTKWERYRNISIKSIYYFDNSVPEAK